MPTQDNLAEQFLFADNDLHPSVLQDTLHSLIKPGLDWADLYLQHAHQETWGMEDRRVKRAAFTIDRGLSVRLVSGEQTGFAYTDVIDAAHLKKTTAMASQLFDHIPHLEGDLKKTIRIAKKGGKPSLYPYDNPLSCWPDQKKIALLQDIDKMARAMDQRITRVNASLSSSYHVIGMVHLGGEWIVDRRPMIFLHISVIAEEGGEIRRGFSGCGARDSYAYLTDEDRVASCVKRAVSQAIVNLRSVPTPGGTMPVVLGPGWPGGVLLHEAIGHGLEGDFNRKGTSTFSGRIGERVASTDCTIVDDGQIAGRRGSLNWDDEGTPTERTILVEKGILKGYMHDQMNARLMKQKPTGNGRRESYAHLPMPRMTNTILLAGEDTPESIIASVDHGLYVADMSGGQVDITSGQFVFSASEAYLIEKGKLKQPVKDATLIGNGPDVLTKIVKVGTDLALDRGIGNCVKDGQSLAVGVGLPTVLVRALVVGGTQV